MTPCMLLGRQPQVPPRFRGVRPPVLPCCLSGQLLFRPPCKRTHPLCLCRRATTQTLSLLLNPRCTLASRAWHRAQSYEQLPSCDIVFPQSRVEHSAGRMKIPTRSPLSIFGFGQELTPLTSTPEDAARTSQGQGWPGPGGRARGEALQGSKSSMSAGISESLSQDMEPLSPVAREYRRRPRNLSSELTEPKVHRTVDDKSSEKRAGAPQGVCASCPTLYAHKASCTRVSFCKDTLSYVLPKPPELTF